MQALVRVLLLGVLVGGWWLPSPSWAATVLAHTCTPVASNASDTITSLNITCTSTTIGSFMAFYITHEGAATTLTMTGDGSSLSKRTYQSYSGGDLNGQLHYRDISPGGTTTFNLALAAGRQFVKIIGFEFTYTAGTLAFDDEAQAEGTAGDTQVLSSGVFDSTSSSSVLLGAHSGYSGAEAITTEKINEVDATSGVTNQGSTYLWYRVDAAFGNGEAKGTTNADGNTRRYLISGYSFAITGGGGPAVIPFYKRRAP